MTPTRPKPKEIENRQDIALLVTTFYAKIQKDPLLGPIFKSHIPEDKWPAHLEKLTDFWMTALFGKACFKGNPGLAHQRVDQNLNYTVQQKHFGQWLNLWYETIDHLYKGTLAKRAKDASRNMATRQYITIYNNRPPQYTQSKMRA